MITEKDIFRIATLAKLEIKSEEVPYYLREIERLLNFAEAVNDAEISSKEISEAYLDFNDMREDIKMESFESSDILSNANEAENGFFKLRKRA